MNIIDRPVPPRLPDPPPSGVNPNFFMSFSNALRLYFNRLNNVVNLITGTNGAAELQAPHAMLMSDEDQANASTTAANSLKFDTPVITQGIEVKGTNDEQIWFEKAGQYLVTFTLQVSNRSNAIQEFEVWAGYNGENYPLSNTRFDIPARKDSSTWAHIVPAITGIFTVSDPSTEYLTIKWWASSTDVFLEHYAAGTSPTRPEIPSVIMTINFVSRLPQSP
jgi:hypothetical protein